MYDWTYCHNEIGFSLDFSFKVMVGTPGNNMIPQSEY